LEVIVELDCLFHSGSFETGEEGQGFLLDIRYVGTRRVLTIIKPFIIYLLMDTEDVLVAEASVLHVAGGTGEATFSTNALHQPFDTIVADVVVP
jgi:hypothetical protein